MKRVLTTLLSLAMVFSLAAPVGAAQKATASTMRLMATEGTAAVENAAGKKLNLTKNMRLYNGYEVSTKAASYAYVSLDSSKAVKLDASSAAEVFKSGRKLELKLTDGKLFFNVPVALKSDESMEIRTSTMMMGVRGTSGWVSVLDRYTTRIGILEGMVTIYSQDPITGADRSVTITGGQTATIIRHERAQAMEQELIRQGVIIEENIVEELTELGQVVEEMREDGVPGFAAAEVAKDADLQDRINNESPLDADLIAQNAEQKLAEDEAAAAQKEAAQQPQDDTKTEPVQTLFAEPETIIVTETVVVTEIKELPGETAYADMDDPTSAELNQALTKLNTVAITNVNSTAGSFNLKDVTIAEGKTVYVVSGEVDNSGTSSITGTLNILSDASLNNTGTLSVNSTNSLHVYGTLINEGTLSLGGQDGAGKIVIEKGGLMKNYGDVNLNVDDGSSFVVLGDYEDYVNEVMSQSAAGTVTYLGSFDGVSPDQYSGKTFKVLNAGTVTTNNTLLFSESTHITLDMNGNAADLVNFVSGDSGSIDEVNRLYMAMRYAPRSLNEYEEEYNSANLTLMDSVGGGKLNGNIVIDGNASLRLKSGTLVVPECGIGVLANSGNFVMTGGTIDAREDDAVALNLKRDGYEYLRSLHGGIIMGTPTSYGAYYYYDSPFSSEGNTLPLVRVKDYGDDNIGSDADLDYWDGYDEGYYDGYRNGNDDSYYDGFKDGLNNTKDKNYDNGYSDTSDEDYPTEEGDYNDGYNVGYRAGYIDGYDVGYSRGYYYGSEIDSLEEAYQAGCSDASNLRYGDAEIQLSLRLYRIDEHSYDSPYFPYYNEVDEETEERTTYVDLSRGFIPPGGA